MNLRLIRAKKKKKGSANKTSQACTCLSIRLPSPLPLSLFIRSLAASPDTFFAPCHPERERDVIHYLTFQSSPGTAHLCPASARGSRRTRPRFTPSPGKISAPLRHGESGSGALASCSLMVDLFRSMLLSVSFPAPMLRLLSWGQTASFLHPCSVRRAVSFGSTCCDSHNSSRTIWELAFLDFGFP